MQHSFSLFFQAMLLTLSPSLCTHHRPVGWKRDSIGSPFDENGKLIMEGVTINETWAAMEELVQKGKVKAIGISNFNMTRVKSILKTAKIKPVVNQFEIHPYFPQFELVKFCQDNDIVVRLFSSKHFSSSSSSFLIFPAFLASTPFFFFSSINTILHSRIIGYCLLFSWMQ